MDSLNLSIPQQHDYTDPTVELDVARLQHWLTDLPLMDVVETVRLVTSALDALNEQKLGAGQRFQILEVYRATALRLFVTVDPLHLRQLALSKSQRKDAIHGVERLFTSIAGGYKLIVTEVYTASVNGKPEPLLGPAINRALEQLGLSLLDNHRFYREIQPQLVSESHQLYRLARHNGLLGSCIDDSTEAGPSASIAAHYHTSMLLSLTDPSRLAEGEAGLLFDVLMPHAESCRIIPGSDWSGSGEGFFLIDLSSDALPVPCAGLPAPVTAREPYLLDATVALAAVRERLAKTPAKVRMQSPVAMVLRRLLPERAGAEQRREQRRPDGRWINLLRGLEGVHAYLAGIAQKGPGTAAVRHDRSAVDMAPCRVLDASDSGMKLVWEGGGAGDACVGDLLGILEDQHGRASLQLGMIRSIRVYREGGMEAGIQLLPGGLGAVSCHMPEQPEKVAVRALFMPASEAEQAAATLVAAKGLYAEGRQLLIDVGDREVRARAGRRVLDSPGFDRFEFSAE
ncbi:MAG: hypothetical protein QNL87_07255 [Gammaproteobacteria bacterium]|nr:hypothetical protein [Gammaproteobacteria bacterium]